MGNTWPLPNQLKKTTENSNQPDLGELGQDRRHRQRSTHRNSLQWHMVEGHSYNRHTLSSFQSCCLAETSSQVPKKEAHRILLDQVPCNAITLYWKVWNRSHALPLPSKLCQLTHGTLKTHKHCSFFFLQPQEEQFQTMYAQLMSYKIKSATPSEATAVDQDPSFQSGAQRTNTKYDYPTLTFRFISHEKEKQINLFQRGKKQTDLFQQSMPQFLWCTPEATSHR